MLKKIQSRSGNLDSIEVIMHLTDKSFIFIETEYSVLKTGTLIIQKQFLHSLFFGNEKGTENYHFLSFLCYSTLFIL